MKMEKRKFRIGELANQLNVERFVIRFWEKEFNIKSQRSHGGQRFYSTEDLNTFKTVKELLYEKRFTIAGAKQMLKRGSIIAQTQESTPILASHVTTIEQAQQKQESLPKDIVNKLQSLQKKLVTLKGKLPV